MIEKITLAEESESYLNKKRTLGSGKFRINTPLKLTDDLYSMLFVSSLHPEYILNCKQSKEVDDNDWENLMDEFK